MYYSPEQLHTFVAKLKAGEVVAAPAEGVYGYCCDPFSKKGLEGIIALKQRAPEKGFVVLISDLAQLKQLCPPLTCGQHERIDLHWPDQTTLVFPVEEGLLPLLTGGFNTIAIRYPKAPYMLEYLKAWGRPLVSTSANISGEPPIFDQKNLPKDVFSLPTPVPLKGGVSTLIDATTGEKYR